MDRWVLGHASIVLLRRHRKVSDGGRVAAIVRENAGGAGLNLSCVHMLMEGPSGKVPLQIQVPDHLKLDYQLGIVRGKTHPFQKINGFEHKIFASETGIDTISVDMSMFGDGQYLRSFFEYGIVEFPFNSIPSGTTEFFWDDL